MTDNSKTDLGISTAYHYTDPSGWTPGDLSAAILGLLGDTAMREKLAANGEMMRRHPGTGRAADAILSLVTNVPSRVRG